MLMKIKNSLEQDEPKQLVLIIKAFRSLDAIKNLRRNKAAC